MVRYNMRRPNFETRAIGTKAHSAPMLVRATVATMNSRLVENALEVRGGLSQR